MKRLFLLGTMFLAMQAAAQSPADKPAELSNLVEQTSNPLSGVKLKEPEIHFRRSMTVSSGPQARAEQEEKKGVEQLGKAFQEAIGVFNQQLSDRFETILLDTGDPKVRNFVAQGILRMNPDLFTKAESGLAALYLSSSSVNGTQRPVCYVLHNPKGATHLWRSFVPANDKSDQAIKWAGAYLVAHEVGHCLDRMQREILTRKGPLDAATLSMLGVPSVAFNRTFGLGRSVDVNEFRSQQVVLYRDGAMLQYQERVADAFALLWVMARNAPEENLLAISQARTRVSSHGQHHAHATAPAVEAAVRAGRGLSGNQDITQLWNAARTIQIQVGVDASLGENSRLVHAEAEKRETLPGATPGQVQINKPLPAVVRFDNLPRFGQ